MSRRTQRATALALSVFLIPALAGCVLQPSGPDTDETDTTNSETTETTETDSTETDTTETDTDTEAPETDDTTFSDANDFLSQYDSAVETCTAEQTQDVGDLVGSQGDSIGLSGATMGTCAVGTDGSFAAAVVLADPSASVNDIESAAPGFLQGLIDGAQGDTLVVGGNWVIFGKGVDANAIIDAFGGESVNP